MSREQGHKAEADKLIRNIKRQTRRKFNTEDKDTDCTGRIAGRGQHCGTVPARRNPSESVLPLEQGVFGGGKEASFGGPGARSEQR